MVRCEMCGQETSDATKVKVEGATLNVCSNCSDHGTEVSTEQDNSSTKYSTTPKSTNSTTDDASNDGGTTSEQSRSPDMFDEMGEVVSDYDSRIRQAREARNMSRTELADRLNEKASRLKKLEQGRTLPDSDIQQKLERVLDVSLTVGDAESEDWDGDASGMDVTLEDVVKRED